MDSAAIFLRDGILQYCNGFTHFLVRNTFKLQIVIPKSPEEIIEEDFSIVFSTQKSNSFLSSSSSYSIKYPPKNSLFKQSPIISSESATNLHFDRDGKRYYYSQILIELSNDCKIVGKEDKADSFYELSIKHKGKLYPKMVVMFEARAGEMYALFRNKQNYGDVLDIISALISGQDDGTKKNLLLIYCEIVKQRKHCFDIPLIELLYELSNKGHNTKESIFGLTCQLEEDKIIETIASDPLFILFCWKQTIPEFPRNCSFRFVALECALARVFGNDKAQGVSLCTQANKQEALMELARYLQGTPSADMVDDFVVVANLVKNLL